MANYTITDSTITIDGRGSAKVPFTCSNGGTPIDISTWTLYFEVDGLATPIRKLLVADPNNATGQLIALTNADVANLKTTACKFVVRDERDTTYPVTLWRGTINRDGFVGAPDTTEG